MNVPSSVSHAENSRDHVPAGFKVMIVLALATVACIGLRQVGSIFAPAFLAFTLVLTVRPLHRWLTKKGLPGWLSAVLTIVTLLCILLSIIGLMVWSLSDLPNTIASYYDKFNAMVKDLMDLAARHNISTDKFTKNILDNLDYDKVVTAVSTVANYLSNAGSVIALVVLTVFFVTADSLRTTTRTRVICEHDSMFYDALSGFEGRVRQYWVVSTLFGAIVAVINGVVLGFLGVPLPFAWAMFSFVTNYIPNIGFVIGVIPPALFGLLDSGWLTLVWVIVAFTVINAVIQGLLQPKITGDAVGLSTTVTFISLLFWAVVIGPMGAVLAVPLTLFAKAILVDSSPQTRWISAFIVPESEATKQYEAGFFDRENPTEDPFVDFVQAELNDSNKKMSRLSLRKKGASDAQEEATDGI